MARSRIGPREPAERPADLHASIPFPPMEAELVRESGVACVVRDVRGVPSSLIDGPAVRAAGEEEPNCVRATVHGRGHQRREAYEAIHLGIDRRAAVEQRRDHGEVAFHRGDVERRLAGDVGHVRGVREAGEDGVTLVVEPKVARVGNVVELRWIDEIRRQIERILGAV